MKKSSRLWKWGAVVYMTALSLFCSLSALQALNNGAGYLPVMPVVLFLLVSAILAALTAVALVSNYQTTTFVFSAFCLSWMVTLVVMNLVFVSLCTTEAESIMGALLLGAASSGLGFVLVWKAGGRHADPA